MPDDKQCFFIAPIGEAESDIRERTNKVMEYIVEEAVTEFGYSVERADTLDEPGSITSQVIEKTVDSDLVVADLTGHNPNVFYELAVRHATGKPFLQLVEESDTIPFDISDIRTIQYGLGVEAAERAREEIQAQLTSLEEGNPEYDNPISQSAEMQALRESTDPTDQNLAEILEGLSRLERKVNRIETQHGRKVTKSNAEIAETEGIYGQPILNNNISEQDEITLDINGNRLNLPAIEYSIEDIETIADKSSVSFDELLTELKKRGLVSR